MKAPRRTQASVIQPLFPAEVVTVTAGPETQYPPVLPEEEACVRSAVPKRRAEFALGRACARKALSQLGMEYFALVNDERGAPAWPQGIVGSLTHCNGFCGIAVARHGSILGLGLDAEPAEKLPAELIPMVCTPREIAWAEAALSLGEVDWYKLIFSAKESVYKCLYPLTRTELDFCEVELRIDRVAGTFGVRLSIEPTSPLSRSTLCGRFASNAKHIFTAVTLTAR